MRGTMIRLYRLLSLMDTFVNFSSEFSPFLIGDVLI